MLRIVLPACAVLVLLAACMPPGGPQALTPDEALTRGLTAAALGDHEAALTLYTRGRLGRPDDARLLAAQGASAHALGRVNQAEPLLRRALASDPELPAAWNTLGLLLLDTDRAPAAVRAFERAFALTRGSSASIRANLSRAMEIRDGARYAPPEEASATLTYRGGGDYLLSTDD
ncbi:Tetratricopeptide repeat-containing protein [Hasllibacter halocynthiae]|uniref:Tetratricopeptide repeat-containing protein n=1 Tax=Hasllibacter halocynthiae TaxID=595589 RepID=A0A2T0X9M8_9RHOB|nr:tetratricopeptide repeat protein [Hasllibacter halocynthiae]PRY95627.1 Tetratricopeptide repeat-containing protein [Hasllibacter halocynthiae]